MAKRKKVTNKNKQQKPKMDIITQHQLNELDKLGVKVSKIQPFPGVCIISVPNGSPDGKLTADDIKNRTEELLNNIAKTNESNHITVCAKVRGESESW